jgi:hypothetical protein
MAFSADSSLAPTFTSELPELLANFVAAFEARPFDIPTVRVVGLSEADASWLAAQATPGVTLRVGAPVEGVFESTNYSGRNYVFGIGAAPGAAPGAVPGAVCHSWPEGTKLAELLLRMAGFVRVRSALPEALRGMSPVVTNVDANGALLAPQTYFVGFGAGSGSGETRWVECRLDGRLDGPFEAPFGMVMDGADQTWFAVQDGVAVRLDGPRSVVEAVAAVLRAERGEEDAFHEYRDPDTGRAWCACPSCHSDHTRVVELGTTGWGIIAVLERANGRTGAARVGDHWLEFDSARTDSLEADVTFLQCGDCGHCWHPDLAVLPTFPDWSTGWDWIDREDLGAPPDRELELARGALRAVGVELQANRTTTLANLGLDETMEGRAVGYDVGYLVLQPSFWLDEPCPHGEMGLHLHPANILGTESAYVGRGGFHAFEGTEDWGHEGVYADTAEQTLAARLRHEA